MTTYNRINAGAAALQQARRLNGEEYRFGGTPPGPTDCSGLVEWSYAQVGVHIARTTYGEYTEYRIGNGLVSEPGDLLFIAGSDAIGVEPGHVMMYVSEGQVFQAPFTGEKIGQYPYDTSVFEYRTRPALALPLPAKPPTKGPTPAQLQHAGLVLLANPSQARIALTNGWPVYVWSGTWFTPTPTKVAQGTPQYANANYQRAPQ